MAFPEAGTKTHIADGLSIVSTDDAGAFKFIIWEHLRTTTGADQPKVLKEFPVTAAQCADIVTAVGAAE
jgi:hypothetical protein